jgi:hypothetical protein
VEPSPPDEWNFDLLNYRGEKVGTWDWKNAYVTSTLENLVRVFGKIR